ADRNRSHWSTSKTPSYTKSVSWQHHRSNVFDEEESKANCVTGGVANVTDGDWLYFLDHYASEKYRRYRYFSQVTACPAILLKISLLIW
ncbi:hypothetical protein ABXW33_19540, partial [Klebsiella pneumoniae]|uniref:hypothetical protein n=1 Tax=Klebsiella pneumoniae TaxID=573 RepID=UPI003398E1BB